MTTFDYDAACRYALQRLTVDLPPSCVYHSVAHTRDEVVPAVEYLARMAHIDGDDFMLLRTAAWFHDVGFVRSRANHEELGVQIMIAILPDFGYTDEQIGRLSGMIIATRLPQTPLTPLEELLADADLYNLAAPNFLERNQDLRNELTANGERITTRQWYANQLAFLQSHRYWSAATNTLCGPAKQEHIVALHRILASTFDDEHVDDVHIAP